MLERLLGEDASLYKIKVKTNRTKGLKLEDGRYAIALQQVAILFSVMPNSAPKWLRRLLGEEFQLCQIKVKTNRPRKPGKQNRSEIAITITGLCKIIRKLDKKGHPAAEAIAAGE